MPTTAGIRIRTAILLTGDTGADYNWARTPGRTCRRLPGIQATRRLHWPVSRGHPNNAVTTARSKYPLGKSLSRP